MRVPRITSARSHEAIKKQYRMKWQWRITPHDDVIKA
jgi:hypothetical protein